ncbi:hypothetical protein [Thermocrinis sp.]
MRFYGIPSEDRALEILENIPDGMWILKDNSSQIRLTSQQVKEKLKDIILTIKSWKEREKHIPQTTVFLFVHTPSEPKHFKIYDLSSLGCGVNLNPPRWECYLLEST